MESRVETVAGARQPSILIVDDHPLWRQTLRTLIERAHPGWGVLEAGDGEQAVTASARHEPDVVVMDMAMPRLSGVEAIAAILEARASARVLVLSSSDDEDQVIAAVRAGASGYLLKNAGGGEILEAIARVAVDELVFPPSLLGLVRAALRGAS